MEELKIYKINFNQINSQNLTNHQSPRSQMFTSRKLLLHVRRPTVKRPSEPLWGRNATECAGHPSRNCLSASPPLKVTSKEWLLPFISVEGRLMWEKVVLHYRYSGPNVFRALKVEMHYFVSVWVTVLDLPLCSEKAYEDSYSFGHERMLLWQQIILTNSSNLFVGVVVLRDTCDSLLQRDGEEKAGWVAYRASASDGPLGEGCWTLCPRTIGSKV